MFKIIFTMIIIFIAVSVNGQSYWDQFVDSTDNRIDFSQYMKSQTGFMPYLNLITEPAVGYGLAGGLVFFDPFSKHGKQSIGSIIEEKEAPPDIASVFGFGTENGSWGAGVSYKGFWKEDTWRYNGFLGYLSPNINFYGTGDIVLPKPVKFNYKGTMLSQEINYRFYGNWFAGLHYYIFDYQIRPGGGEEVPPGISEKELNSTIAAIGPILEYDNRDNIFTPNRGFLAYVEYDIYEEFVGSKLNYRKLETVLLAYFETFKRFLIVGLRYDGQFSNDDTPFFALPSISMRGIPVMRYQNNNAITLESEQRWNFTDRWNFISFFGFGKTYKTLDTFKDENAYGAVGAGIRYLIMREFDCYGGIDIARGPEDWAFYITVGSAWLGY